MDVIINWATTYVSAHPKIASWLMVVLAIDQVLKIAKNAFKLNIDDNVFDTIGALIAKLISKAKGPNA